MKSIGLLLFLSTGFASARIVTPVTPEDLAPQASVICNGLVVATSDSGEKIDSTYENVYPPLFHEKWMIARVKVLHIFKGAPPGEFQLRYRITPPDLAILDGPEHVHLQPNSRYRFFLKPGGKDGVYLDALDGQVDDHFAIESLGPHEPDDSPWLTQAAALKIAHDYIARAKPQLLNRLGRGTASCLFPEMRGGAGWTVDYWALKGQGKNVGVLIVAGTPVQLTQDDERFDWRPYE